jgi:hypothetical protein
MGMGLESERDFPSPLAAAVWQAINCNWGEVWRNGDYIFPTFAALSPTI